MEGELRSRVHDLGIEASVRFVPAVQDVTGYLAAADVVVTPSFYEGLSNVLLEAMMAGTPVVATAASGNVDLVRDGGNGRLVPAGDVAALAEAIGQTLTRPGNLGACGRQTALATCELGHVVDQYEAVFKRACVLPPGIYDGQMLVEPEWNWTGIGAR
jgi:glycosyltransferase involved in cell wall biosynthesis